ncbi:MAG: hypothetical protein RLZZ553_322 [Verrucomicrobiota bacterium]
MPQTRFQIEEMLSQDAHGAVFLAMDGESGREVILQRFFPFGVGEVGLNLEERAAYDLAIQSMMQLDHLNLRAVIEGGSDAVDGMPFVVTEARRGLSLREYSAHSPLTVEQGRILVESALQLMLWLEQRIGHSVEWLALHPGDVEVNDEGNVYRFCVDPMKWLGLRQGPGAVKELVQLAEDSLGWTGRVVTGSTAGLLSGWLRMAKSRNLTVEEALVVLRDGQLSDPHIAVVDTSSVFPPAPHRAQVPASYPSPVMLAKTGGNAIWYILGSLLFFAVMALGGFVWVRHHHSKMSSSTILSQEKKKSSKSKERGLSSNKISKEQGSPATDDEENKRQNAEKLARQLQGDFDPAYSDPENTKSSEIQNADQSAEYEPSHIRGIRMQLGKEIYMTQKVTSVRLSGSGKSLYLEFDGDGIAANRACGRYLTNLGVAGMSVSDLGYLKGKKVRILGKVVEEFGTNRVMVDLIAPSQIEVLDGK